MNEKEFSNIVNKETIETDFRNDNIETLKKMITMCHDKNIEVFLVVTPYADSSIFSHKNNDEFNNKMKVFSDKNKCFYFDFNLVKCRFEKMSDKIDWWDTQHLSKHGAEVFSQISAEILRQFLIGQNISQYFYGSYEELKQYSPYSKYYNNFK